MSERRETPPLLSEGSDRHIADVKALTDLRTSVPTCGQGLSLRRALEGVGSDPAL